MGQGMNVSMQDSYNLGWKLGSVITGTAKPDILSTYESERRPIATELIELDKRMSRFYSQGPSPESEEYQAFRDSFAEFLSGVSVTYSASLLVSSGEHDGAEKDDEPTTNGFTENDSRVPTTTRLARSIHLGRRLPSHTLLCHAEATVVQTSDLLPSTGSWRILVFAGDLTSRKQLESVNELGTSLDKLLKSFNPPTTQSSPVIEVLLLHSGSREAFDLLDLHDVYHPWDEKLGYDYWKVYADDATAFETCGSAYEAYGVDKTTGCLVVVRPDQHVSYIRAVADHQALHDFFAGCLVERRERRD